MRLKFSNNLGVLYQSCSTQQDIKIVVEFFSFEINLVGKIFNTKLQSVKKDIILYLGTSDLSVQGSAVVERYRTWLERCLCVNRFNGILPFSRDCLSEIVSLLSL